MLVDSFKKIISASSKAYPLKFLIWENCDAVYCSDTIRIGPDKTDLTKIANLINQKKQFIHQPVNNDIKLYGLPLNRQTSKAQALIAYYYSSDRISDGEIAKINPDDIKQILTSIATHIEHLWDQEHETDDILKELGESYDTIYLYASFATHLATLKFSGDELFKVLNLIRNTIKRDIIFSFMSDKSEYSHSIGNTINSKSQDQTNKFVEQAITVINNKKIGKKEKYFIIHHSKKSTQFKDIHTDPFQILAVKVQNNDIIYGWLGLVSFNIKKILTRNELRMFISFAEQLALVIRNCDLYQNLETFVVKMVKSLVYAIEAKDVYTSGHSERVHHYSMLIAEKLDMTEEAKNHLYWASLLHDIGKIGIPGEILNKPGTLTQAEFSIIKEHPIKGVNILKPLDQINSAIPGIMHHHEQYDGNGYPSGLKGEQIPLIARIIAIADTFDAITSDRAYRKGMVHKNAMKIINKVAGNQLDPKLVTLFNQVYKENLIHLKSEVLSA
jgi:HD-GYP domain-containing protein (c-di-GMP phosphodiesterase class II)